MSSVSVSSESSFFDDGKDIAVSMMDKTIAKMKQRKREKRVDGVDTCNLDLDAGVGKLYMKPDQSAVSVGDTCGPRQKTTSINRI